jgi:hypothetical protein
MKLHLSREELFPGLEIVIDGVPGDPTEKVPGTSVFIEFYEGKVLCHVWTEGKQDCQTIELTKN